jgi:hypothetical protein
MATQQIPPCVYGEEARKQSFSTRKLARNFIKLFEFRQIMKQHISCNDYASAMKVAVEFIKLVNESRYCRTSSGEKIYCSNSVAELIRKFVADCTKSVNERTIQKQYVDTFRQQSLEFLHNVAKIQYWVDLQDGWIDMEKVAIASKYQIIL